MTILLALYLVAPWTSSAWAAEQIPKDRWQTRKLVYRGHRVTIDTSNQRLSIKVANAPPVALSSQLLHCMDQTEQKTKFISAPMLALKAKQFDDGLMAAVDIAMQSGTKKLSGRDQLLKQIAQITSKLSNGSDCNVDEVINAAWQLSNNASLTKNGFNTAPNASDENFRNLLTPIGFYSWTPELTKIYKQNRILQTPLRGEKCIQKFAEAMHHDKQLWRDYVQQLELSSKISCMPSKNSDLRYYFDKTEQSHNSSSSGAMHFIAPGNSLETDLFSKLYKDQPGPDKFNLADEILQSIRSQKINFTPNSKSGWYDYQLWALEPMAAPKLTPEANRIEFQPNYIDHIAELFKGLLALTRETQIAHISYGGGSGAAAWGKDIIIDINPDLSVEALPTYYLRRAIGYRFIHNILDSSLGAESLAQCHRLRAEGQSTLSLNAELDQIEHIFLGAYLESERELGSSPKDLEKIEGRAIPATAVNAFRKWAATAAADPDVIADARMMVPVFYDSQKKKTKVWIFMGWVRNIISIGYARQPKIASLENIADPSQNKIKPEDRKPPVKFEFKDQTELDFFPVTAEVYVDKVLDRDAFRHLCNQCRSAKEVLTKLGASTNP